MCKIIVGGHICLDIIPTWKEGNWEKLSPGSLVVTDELKFSTGGCVANTGISLKRLGITPLLIGKIGNDEIGKLIIDVIESNGKGLSDHLIVSSKDHSSYTIVLSPPDADRAFLHYPGANDTFCAQEIEFGSLKGSEVFHFGYPSVMKRMSEKDGKELIKIFTKAHEFQMVTSLDMTMPAPTSSYGKTNWQKFLKNVLPHTDVFLPSVGELFYMLGMNPPLTVKTLRLVSEQLIQWGAQMVIIKMGEDGLYFRSEEISDSLAELVSDQWSERELIAPAFKVKIAGTTGAGDASIAGFLTGFVEKMDPLKALAIASATGAFCVEKIDSTSGVRPLSTVLERIEKGWEMIRPKMKVKDWKKGKYGVLIGPHDSEEGGC